MRAKLKKGIEMVRGGASLAALSSTSCSSLALFFHTLAFAFPSSFCYLMDIKIRRDLCPLDGPEDASEVSERRVFFFSFTFFSLFSLTPHQSNASENKKNSFSLLSARRRQGHRRRRGGRAGQGPGDAA
jgi:hypothetical protein